MRAKRSTPQGFTLVELAVTLLLMGLLFAFSVPAFNAISASYQLKGSAENVAGQIRLSREKAIGVGHQQRWTFDPSINSYQVRDLTTGEVYGPWGMPARIGLVSANLVSGGITSNTFTLLTDGRSSGSGDIVLQDFRGNRDTVTVQVSGLVLTH